jgi:5-methylcytosine-specific restriction endonuclease McrA
MHKITSPKQRNRPTLHRMAKEYSDLKQLLAQIRQTQLTYRFVSRQPKQLPSLGLNVATTKWLCERYQRATKGLGLEWIKELRTNHHHVSCPMCGSTNVTSLDHILPKEDYPELAVFSYNLVPSCQPCNNRRGKKGAAPSDLGFIHPYFDSEILDVLELRVQFTQPFSAVGFELLVNGVQGVDFDRVTWHVNNSINFAVFRRSMRSFWTKRWEKVYANGNTLRNRKSIIEDERIESKVNSRNSWEAAFLRGLASDIPALEWMSVNDPSLTLRR